MKCTLIESKSVSGLAGIALTLVAAGPLAAQEHVGKVQGRVVDDVTRAPIPGASVQIVGTTIVNLTNEQGYYFLNDVPAGLHTVEADFIGYRPVQIADERILAGQATTLNFSLVISAVRLETIVVEGERNPLVPRDQTSTKAIVQGDLIDQLPLDNTAGIIVLQPGVVETNRGRTIRGGRPNEEALFLDGMLARGFGTGNAANLELPTNALEQVDVNVGGFAAEFGEAQSGIVSYVTRTGGSAFTGSLEYLTDQLSPDHMRTNFNRAELTLGGPIAGPLTFFVAGTAEGRDAFTTTDAPTRYVIDGDDICPDAPQFAGLCTAGEVATFRLPRGSAAPGATDFVDVTAPSFVPWDDGRTIPFGWSQSDLFHGNLSWQLPRGSRINLSYNRNRFQQYGPAMTLGPVFSFESTFHTDGLDGFLSTRNSLSLSWLQTITQSADQQLVFDFLAAYSVDRGTIGMMDQLWWRDHQDPLLGYVFEDIEFAYENVSTIHGFDIDEPADEFINAFRSGAIPRNEFLLFPNRNDLTGVSQSLTGLAENLRSNPYAMKTSFGLRGPGQFGIHRNGEDRLQLRGSLDWQIGRFNRAKLGAEYFDVDLRAYTLWLSLGNPLVEKAQPTRIGAFLQNRLDIGDLVLETGIRWDYLDPDLELPRTPGFVYNVPDSLKAGFVKYAGPEEGYVPMFDEPCGGVSASNPNGTCLSNFIGAESKSELSPRIGVAFPVTPTSTFRLSYGRFVQTPAFYSTSAFFQGPSGVAEGNVGALENAYGDLTSGFGRTGSFATFARDVEMPATRTFEFGYRQLVGGDLVLDLSAFNKKQRGALTSRQLPFEDPNNGALTYLNVLTNDDFTESSGFELKADYSIGSMVTSSLSYSYLDARGTGSDPFFYEQFIRLGTTNLSALTNEPPNPPALLLRLEQSRKHSISWTGSLVLPSDFRESSIAGALLRDLGVFAIMRIRSGLPYTKVRNDGRGIIGPPSQWGRPQGTIGGAETPWTFGLDLRITKRIPLGNAMDLQAFVDWRNPFDIENNKTVFLETGNAVNAFHRQRWLGNPLQDPSLDGTSDIDDFDIVAESPDNTFNKYMLLRAEQRWGNGDGIFTVAEQEVAFGQPYDNEFGRKSRFETSDQQLRLGLRLGF